MKLDGSIVREVVGDQRDWETRRLVFSPLEELSPFSLEWFIPVDFR
jgi:hypothetical protein